MRVSLPAENESEEYEITQPEPAALVESLRAFGYSLPTAVADLIDNSISAKAKNVWVHFEWNGADSYLLIKDDGGGMSEAELVTAMRPGSKNPLEERPPKDLGRFGLGLKTASFSQCRKLCVVSKQAGTAVATRCWDLDYINATGEWRLLKIFKPDPLELTGQTLDDAGTMVLWEEMDRVVGNNARVDDTNAYNRFLEAIEEVRDHLGMVFHRYLEKPAGLKMWINDRQIKAWDPFLKNEPATQELPLEKLFCGDNSLTVVPFVLPHQSKISQEIHKTASGPAGWNAQQGFYVYRNERLLVAGDWLGLGFQKEEHYKLARIKIDLPNSMDNAWQIDVKKSRAKPPGYLRHDLKRIARLVRERAVQIYRHRGKVTARRSSQEHVFLWEQKTRHGKYFYVINREHPAIQNAFLSMGESSLEPILRMLEEMIPSAHIMIACSEEPHKMSSPFEYSSYKDVRPLIELLYVSFQDGGCEEEDIFARLSSIEPFNSKPEFIEIYRNEKGEL